MGLTFYGRRPINTLCPVLYDRRTYRLINIIEYIVKKMLYSMVDDPLGV